ncbi:hypothetical protein BROUX41_003143 [Berkeleyomyces rouxiae]
MSALAAQSFFRLLARHEGHHHDEAEEPQPESGELAHHEAHTHNPDRQWAHRNHFLGHLFTSTVMLVLVIRLAAALYQSWSRRRRTHATAPLRQPSSQPVLEKIATANRSLLASLTLAVSATLKIRSFKLPVVPLGQILFVAVYCAFVAGLLSYRVVKHDETYAERIGFRGALISVPQVPIVYVLATRVQIPGLRYVLGGSYKDLIWFHRWVSRVFIGSVTVHAVAFFVQWAPAHFLSTELEIVPYVKWGIVAWAIMLWTVVSSLLPLRKLSYEFFVIQHTICAFLTLWLMWLHVPGHHRRSIEMAVGLIVIDWVSRFITAVYMNISWKSQWGQCAGYNFGHKMTLEAVGKDMTEVTLHNAGAISFQAGQSIDIWMPMFPLQSPHPFTILPPTKDARACQCPRIQLALKTKTGFTAKLNDLARATRNDGSDRGFRAFVMNKEGRSPPLDKHDTVVLVSSSTGASFSAAVVEKILAAPESHVRRIKLLMIGREKSVLNYYRTRITTAVETAVNQGVTVSLEVALTGRTYQNLETEANGSTDSLGSLLSNHDGNMSEEDDAEKEPKPKPKSGPSKGPPPSLLLKPMKAQVSPLIPLTPYTATSTVFSPGSPGFDTNDDADIEARKVSAETARSSLDMDLDELGVTIAGACEVTESYGRPSVALFINTALSGPCTGAVSVCGGPELVADVRTTVARINTSRATYAQESCYLHVEGFSTGS